MSDTATVQDVRAVAARGQEAATTLAVSGRAQRDLALTTIADAILQATDDVLAANERDVTTARDNGTPDPMIDRLALDADRVAAMAQGLRDVAGLADPLGEVVRGYTTADGLEIRQIRVPFGVIAMIYEGRPNVTVDAAGLALKSGNVALLRGSASAIESNRALVTVMSAAAEKAGLPADSVLLVPGTDRASVDHLLTARGLVDLVIPRGGAGLIEHVVTHATVPVIETGTGNCHVYIDAAADLDMAERIVVNSVSHRVSVCNSAESVLVHRDIASQFLPRLGRALRQAGVTIHGDDTVTAAIQDAVPATDDDWGLEYLSLDAAVAVVDDLDEAIAHIRRWSTSHTEAVVTRDLATARAFAARVDSAAVMINASTRFTDGAVFGMGAEIGISTQKMHARGPMGLTELTSTKWIVTGDGHIR